MQRIDNGKESVTASCKAYLTPFPLFPCNSKTLKHGDPNTSKFLHFPVSKKFWGYFDFS